MRRFIAIAAMVVSTLSLALPSLASEPDATYLDQFSSQGFGGNDGTLEFNGPWVEIGESNGPTSGNVWVWNFEYCDGEFCLKMGGTDGAAEGRGAYRAVDLTGATSAKLRIDYGRALLDDESQGTAVVQVSPDGGDTWATLKTISLDEDDDGLKKAKKFDISNWATGDTMIRFLITEAENLQAYWLIDNVKVEVSFEQATTTTTTEATTTTIAPATTTTTEPLETTTTTVKVETTTTTKPRETTTTTRPPKHTEDEPVTTTSAVPRTTTTLPTTPSTTQPPDPGSDVPAEDRDTMRDKTGLAIVSALPPVGMPASNTGVDADGRSHAEPVEALAAAFFTDSGDYGGNLLPSVALGVIIAVVTLLGVGSPKQD